MKSAKAEIMGRLRKAVVDAPGARSGSSAIPQLPSDPEELTARFMRELASVDVTAFRADDSREAVSKIAGICESEKIKKLLLTADDTVGETGIKLWAEKNDIDTFCTDQFDDNTEYKSVAFDEVQAGITGVEFGVAESGTLVLAHGKSQARLVSLAPEIHIALLPMVRLVPNYENAMNKLYADKSRLPSQVTFVTGASLTSDIGGIPIRGMHGPCALFVILIG
ncbi:MAG: hypothetical protein GY866_40725 [Proteobacteria bacterium]|nr:hypothetical protein [Pseudomonadota bacterium]